MERALLPAEAGPHRARRVRGPPLLVGRAGGLAHFRLAPGRTSIAQRHRSIEELWFFVGGLGEMIVGDEVTTVAPGVAVRIPPGTRFQFRSLGLEPLEAVAATMPRGRAPTRRSRPRTTGRRRRGDRSGLWREPAVRPAVTDITMIMGVRRVHAVSATSGSQASSSPGHGLDVVPLRGVPVQVTAHVVDGAAQHEQPVLQSVELGAGQDDLGLVEPVGGGFLAGLVVPLPAGPAAELARAAPTLGACEPPPAPPAPRQIPSR